MNEQVLLCAIQDLKKVLNKIENTDNYIEEDRIRLEKEVARCEKMLSNPGFVNKDPQSKIEEEKTKLIKYREMLQSVLEQLCN